MQFKKVLTLIVASLIALETPLFAVPLATQEPSDKMPVAYNTSAQTVTEQKNETAALQTQNTPPVFKGFEVQASTNLSDNKNLLIQVTDNAQINVTWGATTYKGTFDPNSLTAVFKNPTGYANSTWTFGFSKSNQAANLIYNLSSLIMSTNQPTANYYTTTSYQFTNNLLSQMSYSNQSANFYSSGSSSYTYTQVNGHLMATASQNYSSYQRIFSPITSSDGSVINVTSGASSNNGTITYFAYYTKTDKTNHETTYAYAAGTDPKLYFQTNSLDNIKVIDNAATTKTVTVYSDSSLTKWIGTIYSAKDTTGNFVAKMVQTGDYSKNYIVVGAADLTSTEKNDTLFSQYQSAQGYTVYYGMGYKYTNNVYTALGYGLNFVKNSYSPNGVLSNVVVSVDYPKVKTVTLDGKVYDINLTADGKLSLTDQAERLLKEAAQKLMTRIEEAKAEALAKVQAFKDQIVQITKSVQAAVASIQKDLDSGKISIQNAITSLNSLSADTFLGDATRKQIQQFGTRMAAFLSSDTSSSSSLAGIAKKYFDELLNSSLQPAQSGCEAWTGYEVSLMIYSGKVSSAKTLEELKALEQQFPVTPSLAVSPVVLPPDPKAMLQQVLNESAVLIDTAKKEIAKNKAAAIDLSPLAIPKNSAQGGVDVNILDWAPVSGMTAYTVLRREFGKTDWQVIFQDSKDATRYLDKNINTNTAYEYDVKITSTYFNGSITNLYRSNNYEDSSQGLLPKNILILINNNELGFVDIAEQVADYQKADGKLDPITESQLAAFLGLSINDLANGNTKWHILRDAATKHLFIPLGVYYAYRRGIPTKNIVFMDNISTAERPNITSDEFDRTVIQPIKNYLIANNLMGSIESIVSTYHFPIIANGHAWESELNFSLWKALGKDTEKMYSLFDEGHPFSRINGDAGFLTTRIDAADIVNARRMIDDAIWAEENYSFDDAAWRQSSNLMAYIDWQGKYPTGDIWFENPNSNPYDSADDLLKTSGIFGAQGENWDSSPNLTNDFINKYDADKDGKLDNTLLFEGWYNYWQYQNVFDWARGAIGWSLDSASANSFRYMTDPNNSSLHAWGANVINRGATASLGAVNEPLLTGHTRPDLFMYYILNGYSFAEAATYSTPMSRTTAGFASAWMMAVNGDPLYTPFKVKSKISSPTEPIIENNVTVGYRVYNNNKWGLLSIGYNTGYKEYDLNGNLTGEKRADGSFAKHLKNGRSVFYTPSLSSPVTLHIYSKDGTIKTVTIPTTRPMKSDEVRYMSDGSIQIVRTFSNPPDVYVYDESGKILSINGVATVQAPVVAAQVAAPVVAGGPAPILPAAQTNNLDLSSVTSVRDHLIADHYFTQEEYDHFVEAATFDEVFSRIDTNKLGQLLIDQHLLKADIPDVATLINRLKAKGIDPSVWQLRPDGFLSAVGDVRGEGTLFAHDLYRDKEILMLTTDVQNKLIGLFSSDHEKFVDLLSVNAFLDFLGAVPAAAQVDPILADTWTALDTTNPYIVNPTSITYMAPFDQNNIANENTKLDYYLSGYWTTTAQSVVDSLATQPEGHHAILINSRTYRMGGTRAGSPRGGNAIDLDPLRDANGNYVVRPVDTSDEYWGNPYYYFPTLTLWTEVMQQRLDSFVKAIKDNGGTLDYVILDYEQRNGTFSDWLALYKGHYDLFFQDPRTADLLKNMGITKEQMMATTTQSYNTWWGTLVQLKWDKYVEDQRALAIKKAVFDVFKKYFPDVATSNWSNHPVTDLVPMGDYRGGWGLGSYIPGTTTTNDFYATQSPIFLPTGYIIPKVNAPNTVTQPITDTFYFTMFNALTTQLNEANTISAATSLRTSNWVANPAFIDLYLDGLYGPNMTYDSALSRYVSRDGQGGEGIGTTMAELWYRAAAEADVLNFYNSDYSRTFPGYDAKHDVFGERTINEVNEMLGYSDRNISLDGWVLINGQRVSIGPSRIQFDASPLIWGATANGKNLYRVIFDIPEGGTREQFLVNDGSDGKDVVFMVNGKEIRIPNAHIAHPTDEVSKQGFWVVQDPAKMGLLHNTAEVILNSIDKPKTSLPGDANKDGRVNIVDINLVSNTWLATKNDARFNPNADLNNDGIINGMDLAIINSNWGKQNPPVVAGDANHDGLVNSQDLALINSSWGLSQTNPNFNPDADVNHDGKIDISDINFLANHWTAQQIIQTPAPAALANTALVIDNAPQLPAIDLNKIPDVRDRLVELGYFTKPEYDQFIQSTTFDEVFAYMDAPQLGQLLIDQHLLKADITNVDTLIARLKAKGIDPTTWKLRPYGFLSAVGDVRGEGSLFATNLTNVKDILMLTTDVKNKLQNIFANNHEELVNRLAPEAFLELLGGLDPSDSTQVDPILAYTWSTIYGKPLDTTNPYIVNPVLIGYMAPYDPSNPPDASTTLDDYLQGYWWTPADDVANALLEEPEGQRSVLMHSRSYTTGAMRANSPRNPFAPQLDPLQDADGNFVVRDPSDKSTDLWGQPYMYFPTQTQWVEIMQKRLDPFVKALKDKGATVDYIVLDYEERDASFLSWVASYRDHYDLFFQDPRTAGLLKAMDLTKEEIMAAVAMPNYSYWGSMVQIKWDKYVENQRSQAIYDGIFSVFKKYFPDVQTSNWSNKLITDLVPMGDYRNEALSWGLGTLIPGTTMTNDFYGSEDVLYTPRGFIDADIRAPHFANDPITDTVHYTLFNALTTAVNQANSMTAASATRTSNWVTNPAYIDLWSNGMYGANMKYDSATGRLVSTDGKGGDGIGDVMAEEWYMAGMQAEMLNFYNSDFSRYYAGYDTIHDTFGENTISEVNEMLGYADRNPLMDGWILVDGKRVSVGSVQPQFDVNPLVWAARANGQNVYRVIFDIPDGKTRDSFAVNDGSDGKDVVFMVDGKEIRIPNAHIYHPKEEVSKQGFWVVQDPKKIGLIHTSIDTVLNALKPKPTNSLGGDANKDGVVDISDINAITGSWLLSTKDAHFNPNADLNHDGIINGNDLALISSNWGKKINAPIIADANHDGIVNAQDTAAVSASWGTHKNDPKYNANADVNHDGVIDISDINLIAAYWGKKIAVSLPGDVNHDGIVNGQDIALITASWGLKKTDAKFNPDADLNKDGKIDISDLNMAGSK